MSTLGRKNVCPHYPRWPKWTSGKWLWQAELEHPNVPVLSSKACEYFALHGKEDFADVVKLRTLRWRDDPVDPMSSQGSLKADNLLLLCSEGRCDNGKKKCQTDVAFLALRRKGLWAKEHWQPLELEDNSPRQPPGKNASCLQMPWF